MPKNVERFIQQTPELEPVSDIVKYWKRFNFPFEAPKSGTPAEKRLQDLCTEYTNFIVKPNLRGATGSDGRRRAVHNELCLMIFGKTRDDLDLATAEQIADFATYVVVGMSAEKTLAMFDNAA